MKIVVRSKNKFLGYGYGLCKEIKTKDEYEAKDIIKKELELCKIGDERWHEAKQEFDPFSYYLTDGYSIIWYEVVKE